MGSAGARQAQEAATGEAVEGGVADGLLTRGADATFVLDLETGQASHRWYDSQRSRLELPGDPTAERLVTWLHPDDLPEVLEAFAAVVNRGASRTVVARLHPDRSASPDTSVLINLHDARDIVRDGILVQVWLIDFGTIVGRDLDRSASLSSLAAAAPVGLQVLNTNGDVSFENQRFTTLAGPVRDEIDRQVADALTGRAEVTHDVDAGDVSLRLRVVPTLDDDGALVLAVASLEDVTVVREAQAGRAEAEELFRAVFESSPRATALVGLDGTLVQVNESFALITGYTVEGLTGMRFQDITHPDDLAADEELLAEVVAGTRSGYQMEKRYLHRAGYEIWIELTVAPVRRADGSIGHFVAHVEDITARRSVLDAVGSTDDLTYWATHDHLTGLPNRRMLEHQLAVGSQRMRRAGDRQVVIFLDLDDFKPVNDQYGHQTGDEVLRTVARRLRTACRDEALVARYGGDEFVVVSHRLRTMTDVPRFVERISAALNTPIGVGDDATVSLQASIGISIARPGDEAHQLLARADAAAYRAKAEGKGRVRFDLA